MDSSSPRIEMGSRAAKQHLVIAADNRHEPSNAPPIKLSDDMSVADALAVIVEACLAHYRSNEAVLVATRHPEALHQIRVALRRLQSAFWLFKPALRDSHSRAIRRELRNLTNELGAARNVDVCIARSAKRSKERQWLQSQRACSYRIALKELSAPSSRQRLFNLEAWINLGDWRNSDLAKSPLLPLAAKRIDRLWRRILSFGSDPAKLPDRERHRLRIYIKKIRYALGFLEQPFRSAKRHREAFGSEIETLQDALGSLNDLMICDDLRSNAGLKPKHHRATKAKQLRRARRSLKKLRSIGPYWRGPLSVECRH